MVVRFGSRFPWCVLLALSWNTTNENPSTDKLSRAINYSFGLLVSMSSSMKKSHELRTGSTFFSTVLGMWRSTCFPNKIVCNYYQSWKYCPTNKFMCSWKLLQIWYVTHKDILILSLLSSDSIEKQLHQDFNNGFGFFVWRCCSTKSGCAIEGKGPHRRSRNGRIQTMTRERLLWKLWYVFKINVNFNLD